MPIQEQNIVFVKSQVMDDVPEGGGAATGQVIPDGQMNTVFEDISDLDRAYGRFNLRKLHLAVRSLSTDLYGGAKTIISAIPTDPSLCYTLFSTHSPFDTRTEAANRVEAYLFKGPLWHGVLHENHLSGMRTISVLQRVDSVLPTVGKTLCLVQDEGLAGEKEQYVRVIKVETTKTVFTDANGDFERWVVRMDLSDALRHDFAGHTALRTDSYNYTGKTRMRNTTVADATRYFSTQPLAEPAGIGDLMVRAQSVYTQLVPNNQTETPVIDAPVMTVVTVPVSGGTRSVDFPIYAHTKTLRITAQTRQLNYTQQLVPKPAPGSVALRYRALGNSYLIRDDGAGHLTGDGSGTINYTTGSVLISIPALPDVDSYLLWLWGSPLHFASLGGQSVPIAFPGWSGQLAQVDIVLDSVVIEWTAGGQTKRAFSDASGVIGGDATGRISKTGGFSILPTTLPDPNTTPNVTYRYGASVVENFTPTPNAEGRVTLTTARPIRPGSLSLHWTTKRYKTTAEQLKDYPVS